MRVVLTVASLVLLVAIATLAGCISRVVVGQREPFPESSSPSVAELRDVLGAEFARLGIDPDKVGAAAPLGPENAVFNLSAMVYDPDGTGPLPPDSVELRWMERCIGDYDQNGEVGISDLTPLGQRFGYFVRYYDPQGTGKPDWPGYSPLDDGGVTPPAPPAPGSGASNWRNARIDGDGNGEINISDITPIAVHWQQHLVGYCVYRKRSGEANFMLLPNPDDPGALYTIPRNAAFAAGDPDPNRPLYYRLTDNQLGTASGIFEYYVAAYDGQGGVGTPSPQLTLDMDAGGGGTQPPVAIVVADPESGAAPLTVDYDASESYDPDGLLTDFAWDVPGFPGGWFSTALVPTFQMTYTTLGDKARWVQVTDSDGLTATAEVTVSVGTI